MVAAGAQRLDFVTEEGKKGTQRWNASDDDGHIFFHAGKKGQLLVLVDAGETNTASRLLLTPASVLQSQYGFWENDVRFPGW